MKRLSIAIIMLLLFAGVSQAANELYIDLSTAIQWSDGVTGGAEELDLGDSCGATVTVCVGSYHDWGVDPRPGLYMMVVNLDGFDSAPIVGKVVEIYITESQNGTVFSGPEAPSNTTDTIGSVNRLGNLLGPFPIFVTSTTAGTNLTAVFYFTSYARYFAPAVYNGTLVNFLSTSDAHTINIYPAAWQVQ